MEKNNPFLSIIDGGYIISDETKSLLSELADAYKEDSSFFIKSESISKNYNYEKLIYVILLYIDYALTDNLISEEEFCFIQNLKKSFSIIPGDFYNKKYNDVQRILTIQFHLYYLDNKVDFTESKEIEYLQGIFDLDATKITSFELRERKSELSSIIDSPNSRSIPEAVKREVWERDGGKCVSCGSKETLEFDHDIPFSKGGSSTADNVRILCKECNRKKSDRIC